jgi:signal transduction histidine kinase
MGLALALVQQLAALHRGSSGGEGSGEGSGTTFTFELPRRE